MRTWKHVTLVALAGLLVAAGAHALGSAPLFWQQEAYSSGVTVQRLHDAEAQVNCYVARFDNRGHSGPAISCVKVR